MKVAYDAGMKEKAIWMSSAATEMSALEKSAACTAVGGSGYDRAVSVAPATLDASAAPLSRLINSGAVCSAVVLRNTAYVSGSVADGGSSALGLCAAACTHVLVPVNE